MACVCVLLFVLFVLFVVVYVLVVCCCLCVGWLVVCCLRQTYARQNCPVVIADCNVIFCLVGWCVVLLAKDKR